MTTVMKEVIRLVKENPDYAEDLARALLAAKSEGEISAAFVKIDEANKLNGVTDLEEITRVRVEGIMIKYSEEAELTAAKLKNKFNEDALATTTKKQLEQLGQTAQASLNTAMAKAKSDMKGAVDGVAKGQDTSFGEGAINTIKLAAEIEASMNYVKEKARFDTADADKSFRTAVKTAKTNKEVNEVTDSVVTFVEKFQKDLKKELDDVISKGENDPNLEDRLPEAKDFRDLILSE